MGLLRDRLVRLSQYAANAGGAAFCATKCPGWSYNEKDKGKGCCAHCGASHGYHPEGPQLKKLKRKYKFTSKDGFWSKTGCKLPREKRSNICLAYYCVDAAKSLPLVFHFDDKNYKSLLQNARQDADNERKKEINLICSKVGSSKVSSKTRTCSS